MSRSDTHSINACDIFGDFESVLSQARGIADVMQMASLKDYPPRAVSNAAWAISDLLKLALRMEYDNASTRAAEKPAANGMSVSMEQIDQLNMLVSESTGIVTSLLCNDHANDTSYEIIANCLSGTVNLIKQIGDLSDAIYSTREGARHE